MSVPKLRFKEFEGEWENKKFSEIYDFQRTLALSRADLVEKGEVMNIHYGDIHTKLPTQLNQNYQLPYIKNFQYSEKYSFLQNKDLVFADASEDYADVGKCIEAVEVGDNKIICGLHTFHARPKINISVGFGSLVMQSKFVRIQIKKMATGISVLGISKKNLSRVEVTLPPPQEQTKIADFLTTVDNKINQLTEKHDLLTKYKKGLLQQIFSQKIRFTKDDGSGFDDWKEMHLYDFLELQLRPVKKPPELYHAIGVRSHFKGLFNKYESDPTKNSMDKLYQVKENDVVVNITFAWEGALAIAHKEHINGLVSHRFPTYQCNEKMNVNFFKHRFIQKDFLYQLKLCSPGGAGRNRVLNKGRFLKIKLLVPSIEEQTKIANFLSKINESIEITANQLEQAKTWKKGLLQQMFV